MLRGQESEKQASDGSAVGSNLGFRFVQGPSDVQLENLVIEPSDRWTACSLGAGCLAELLSKTSSVMLRARSGEDWQRTAGDWWPTCSNTWAPAATAGHRPHFQPRCWALHSLVIILLLSKVSEYFIRLSQTFPLNRINFGWERPAPSHLTVT